MRATTTHYDEPIDIKRVNRAFEWLRAWLWRQLSDTTHEFLDANSRWPHWRCSAVLIEQFRTMALVGGLAVIFWGAVRIWAIALPYVAPDWQ